MHAWQQPSAMKFKSKLQHLDAELILLPQLENSMFMPDCIVIDIISFSEILSAYDKELEENYENLKGAKVALHSYFAKNNAAVGKMMASGDYIPPDDAEELNIIDTVCGKILGEQCMKDIADMLPSVDGKWVLLNEVLI